MATVIVLSGPKAVGKSWVARALADRLGVRIDTGERQDPASVVAALRPVLG
jgi:cytidylate kinase